MIYADYAATSGYVPECVRSAVMNAFAHPGNAGRGAHEQALGAGRILLDTRRSIAEFFDAPSPSGVVFTSGMTESLNTVIKGILTKEDHVITTWAEHNSVLRPLYELQDQGMGLTITDPDVTQISRHLQENTRMVIMTHGSNVTGAVYDIEAVGNFCREQDILFVVDTAQTAGHFPVSMKKAAIDVLCFTGHKGLCGPQGTGGMCIGEGVRIRPLKTGGTGMDSFSRKNPKHLPESLEAGTMNIPGIAGLCAAVGQFSETGVRQRCKREQKLAKRFWQGVKSIKDIRLYGDFSDFQNRTAIVSLNIGSYPSASVSDELEQRFGILTRFGAHCAPLVQDHFGTREQGMVRFSFGFETTQDEVDACIRVVRILAEE
ncbi:MAG: aminotransferase class V-fold PLP-dependent enzyme [Hespellia sp.]|nr:aminotransferase class V-fold PLP-dependent enzyme [Hespellia sp.]